MKLKLNVSKNIQKNLAEFISKPWKISSNKTQSTCKYTREILFSLSSLPKTQKQHVIWQVSSLFRLFPDFLNFFHFSVMFVFVILFTLFPWRLAGRRSHSVYAARRGSADLGGKHWARFYAAQRGSAVLGCNLRAKFYAARRGSANRVYAAERGFAALGGNTRARFYAARRGSAVLGGNPRARLYAAQRGSAVS